MGGNALPVDVQKWQPALQRLVSFVKANGRLPQAGSSADLYDWFSRQLRRLGQLPEELMEQLCESHLLIAAAVDAKRSKKREWTLGMDSWQTDRLSS